MALLVCPLSADERWVAPGSASAEGLDPIPASDPAPPGADPFIDPEPATVSTGPAAPRPHVTRWTPPTNPRKP